MTRDLRLNQDSMTFLNRYGHIIVAAAVFILTAMVNINVRLYGDDFAYARFVSGDLAYYFKRHIEHYSLANGRVIVHLLSTAFLAMGNIFWCFANSFMLAGIVFFGSKAVSGIGADKNGGQKLYSAIIIGTAIIFFDPDITRQSLYWLTGSFNYVYPLFVFLIYWYLLSKAVYEEKVRWYIPLAALLSAATVEQVSLMTLGLTLLTVIEVRFIQKRKLNKLLLISLAVSLIGTLTVVASPSVFLRASIENSPAKDLISLVKYNIKFQKDTFLLSGMMKVYHLVAMAAALGIIFKYRGMLSPKWKRIENLIIVIGGGCSIAWLWQVTAFDTAKESGRLRLLFHLIIMGGYILTLCYAGFLAYVHKHNINRTLPLIAVILCLGSQFMMIVSPVYGPRNLISAIIMLTVFSSALIPKLNYMGISAIAACLICFLFNQYWLLPLPVIALALILFNNRLKSIFTVLGIAAGYIITVTIALSVLIPTVKGYSANAAVYDNNLKLAKEYKSGSNSGILTQHKLPLEIYGWAMPYHNPYYDVYYKLYIGVDRDTKINWE